MRSKIKKFGMEIEGEFSRTLDRDLVNSGLGRMVSDGSLRGCRLNEEDSAKQRHYPKGHSTSLYISEFVTKPFDYSKEGLAEAEKLFEILSDGYKRGHFHFNASMGFHIHFSFKSKIPVEIWSLEFVEFFRKRINHRFPEMYDKRLGSDYCKQLEGEEQIALSNDRYREINFRAAMSKHGTIEFRIFAADSPKMMRRYLSFAISTIRLFVKKEQGQLKRSVELEITGKRRISRTITTEVIEEVINENVIEKLSLETPEEWC